MVLATDMAYHKSYLDEFTEKLNNKSKYILFYIINFPPKIYIYIYIYE